MPRVYTLKVRRHREYQVPFFFCKWAKESLSFADYFGRYRGPNNCTLKNVCFFSSSVCTSPVLPSSVVLLPPFLLWCLFSLLRFKTNVVFSGTMKPFWMLTNGPCWSRTQCLFTRRWCAALTCTWCGVKGENGLFIFVLSCRNAARCGLAIWLWQSHSKRVWVRCSYRWLKKTDVT